MKYGKKYLIISLLFFLGFLIFSFLTKFGFLDKIDLNFTVKIQNHIPKELDGVFSFFSVIGGVEIPFFCTFADSIFEKENKRDLSFFSFFIRVFD